MQSAPPQEKVKMVEALVYEKLPGKKVRCLVCQRKCLIASGQTGFCQAKLNREGKLYTLNYGLIQGIQVDPIEKKPFYHFKPGALVPSVGSWGCNFRCKQCLNYFCSWGKPAQEVLKKAAEEKKQPFLKPEALIKKIKKSGYQGIAFTYNEPVVWAEYVLAVAKLAKKEKFFTLFVSNGSWSKETLDKIGPYLDAANLDFKGFSKKTYLKQGALPAGRQAFLNQIPAMAKYAQKKHKIFLEITTLLIPGINDDLSELKKMTKWIVNNLGPKTPWHLSRYNPESAPNPAFQKIPPTTLEQLKKAKKIGQKNGLQFVYIWAPGQNLPNGVYAEGNTICPKCQKTAVRRDLWQPDLGGLDQEGNCRNCGENLSFILS